MKFYFSSKSVNIHPKKSDTIPRFYSNWAISFFEKGLIYRLKKKLYRFLAINRQKINPGGDDKVGYQLWHEYDLQILWKRGLTNFIFFTIVEIQIEEKSHTTLIRWFCSNISSIPWKFLPILQYFSTINACIFKQFHALNSLL
jgi:hypothetical protein